jgi:hypothetical protein
MKDKIRFARIKKLVFFSILMSLFFISFFPVMGSAEPIFTIKPIATVSGQLDSNFYKTENNEEEVYTYLLQPGIQLGAATAKSKLDFIYTLDAYFYSSPAEDENYVGYYTILDASNKTTDRLTLGLKNFSYKTRRVDWYDDFTDTTERRKHTVNRLTPWLYYDFRNRFSVGLRYRWQDVDFEDSNSSDSVEHRGVFDLIYNPSRTTTLDLDYQHWKLNYDQEVPDYDYTSNQVRLIFQKRYKYFSFDAGGGYHKRHFEDPGLEDGDVIYYKVAIGAQNPPSFGIGRRIYERDSLGIKSHIYFDAERNFNDLGSFRTENRFTLSLGHLFLEKIKGGLRGYYKIEDYENISRKDDTYGISGSIRYFFNDRWNLLFITGKTDRDSNVSGYSYENVYLTLSLEFSYPIGSKR